MNLALEWLASSWQAIEIIDELALMRGIECQSASGAPVR
jgi:hypothetical protein